MRVLVNTMAVNGALEVSVTSNNHYRADTFNATLTLSPSGQYFTAGWWSSQDAPVLVEIDMAFLNPGDQEGAEAWQAMITGEVDHVSIDPIAGTVRISGRDLSRRLIDAKTQETFTNQTSSQIAATLAERRGLSTNIATTSTPVGQYYELQHSRAALIKGHRATTEWDLLVWLAQQEGFDVYVTNQTLNFQPQGAAAQTFVVLYQQPSGGGQSPVVGVMGLRLERSQTLAKGVMVKVLTWGSKTRTATTYTAGTGGADTQTYVFSRPNLTPDLAQQYANNMLEDITRHERKVAFSMPGELSLTVRNQIQLDGTGTSFDQAYWIDSMTRSMSLGGGFVSSFNLKNHSPVSEVTE
jgi:phage protein D